MRIHQPHQGLCLRISRRLLAGFTLIKNLYECCEIARLKRVVGVETKPQLYERKSPFIRESITPLYFRAGAKFAGEKSASIAFWTSPMSALS